MVSNGDKWMRIFDIPDISKHQKGFTIYKVISMLYPEACPDAITKITVWKRFNDFKKLHREMKVLHKKLNIKDKYPSLPSSTFFKRFDDKIIQARRESILIFLEYVGCHSQLFTSTVFVKFFESSHTPADQLNSTINSIRADLSLPEDPEYIVVNSDDDRTTSDTDSVTTVNSLGFSFQNIDILPDSSTQSSMSLSKSRLSLNASVSNSHYSRNSDSISISTTTTDSLTLFDGHIYPTPPNTPGCTTDNHVQYIIDASVHVNIAMELENARKYEEAFTAYKTAIDILLKYGKDDKHYERKQMVRYKTEKYLIKAEKIYNMHLASEIKNLKEIVSSKTMHAVTYPQTEESHQCHDNNEHHVQRPISDLYKYKVVRVIASGMLVLHSELQQLFYIKVLHKTMKFLSDNLILPENVPYMIKLYNYYNCEHALFLVLEYCSGQKLWDYNKNSLYNSDVSCQNNYEILRQVQDMDISDAESEHSYSDLINNYANNKSKNVLSTKCDIDNERCNSDDSFEKVHLTDLINSDTNLIDEAIPSTLLNSQLIPESQASSDGIKDNEQLLVDRSTSSRRFSELSSFDDMDEISHNFMIPLQNIVKWSAQLLLALEKLHALGVICCDLQSHNLLINEDGDLMLTYMCNVNEVYDVFNNGRSLHVAPEIYRFEPITNAVDWWCYGVILYELLVGVSLATIHPDGLNSSTSLKIPKYVMPEGRSLLKQLLTFEPQDRLGYGGTDNLKSHPFFINVSWENLLEKYNL